MPLLHFSDCHEYVRRIQNEASSPSFLFEVFEATAVAGVGEVGDGEVLEGFNRWQFLEGPGIARLQLPERIHTCGRQRADPCQGHVSL